jgi:acyl-CoA reductase-like NAD-dependent aldehyde dehydrogenase
VGEVARAAETFKFAAIEAERLHGETIPMDAARGSEHRKGLFIRQPLGVIVAIPPFNFPLNLVAHKVAPALAAGNTVVLKPASATPLTSLKLGELLMEAGLPPGVLNILVGPGSTVGDRLIKEKRVRMVTFTGSPPVGERIKRESGIKKLTLELGSNSGVIIAEDADLEQAIEKCLVGGFAYSGQVCIHTQRIYVHDPIREKFTTEFVSRVQRLKEGDPLDPATEIGPMIDEAAAIKAETWIKEAVEDGAKLLCGGKRDVNFLQPTVLTDVKPEMKVVCEETFAPIVVIDGFTDFEEAIAKFNEGSRLGSYDYGLAAGVFTRDIKKAWEAIEGLEVGNVFINDSATFRVDQMPYGGVKESGLGREGPRFAIEEMTEIKMVSFSL